MKRSTANPANQPASPEPLAPTDQLINRRDDPYYEELSRINNELVNLQRELARTNAELTAGKKKLEASEQRFRSLSACLPIGLFELDSAGRCVFTNSHWQTISGLTAEESLGDGWQRALAPGDAPAFLEARNLARQAGRDFCREVRFVNSCDEQRWAQVRSRAMISARGETAGRVCTVEDITERKQAESQLRKFSHAIEQSPVSIAITDLQGAIEYVNPKLCAMTGYSFDELRGKNFRLLKSGDMPEENYRRMWAKLTAGEEWSGEFHNRKKNGELYFESASISPIRDDLGNVSHFVAVKEDITQRKQASELLLDSQERLELATKSAHIGIWDWDLLTQHRAWDAQMHGLYGTRAPDFDNSFASWQQLLHPDDRDRVMADLQNALAGTKEYHTEFRIVWPNGEVRYLEAHGLVRRADDGSATRMIGVNWDITRRKQSEMAQQEQLALRERLAKIASIVPGIIYAFRLRPDGVTCLPYVSPTIEEFIGLRAEDLLTDASSLLNQIHPDDRSAVEKSIAESARTLLPWRAEFRMRHPRKGLFWIEGHSTPEREADGSILWHGFMSDVTERKQAEQSLRESEDKLSKIFQSSPVAISLSTVREGRLLEVNEEYLRMLERTRGDVLGRTSYEIGIWADPLQRKEVLNQLNQQSSLRNIELDLRAKSGRVHHVLWSSEVLVIQGERCLLGSALDITDRKQAQAGREKLEREVAEHKLKEESARLALEHEQKSSQIKSRFVSMVSHEFRTPLSIINIAAELLDGYLDKMTEAERSEHLTNIRSSVERMTQMMNDFLIHGNCGNGKIECKPAWLNVEALCRRLISEVPSQPGYSGTIECSVDPAVDGAWLDEKILRHILGNLLGNAVKYSVDSQPVKLEVRRIANIPQAIDGPDLSSASRLEFKISDSGIGIPAADLAKLYQTFHRAANVGNRPGNGMGLAIVKQFVDLLGGNIRLESQEGKGTTVWVELPAGPPPVAGG